MKANTRPKSSSTTDQIDSTLHINGMTKEGTIYILYILVPTFLHMMFVI